MENNIPTFTPPAPTFTPPTNAQRNGSCCHFHPNEPAVAKCSRCGKPLCQDCVDTYQVNDEKYQDKALCYDCCQKIVADNVKQLKKQRAKIIAMYIFTALGMIFGAIIGAAMIEGGEMPGWIPVVTAFIGGCLWTFLVNTVKIIANTINNIINGAWLGGIIRFFLDMIKAIIIAVWGTIQKLFYYTKYIIQTSGFIRSDSNALRQMADYMEYTRVRSQNVGVDLATLMNQDSQLYNNSYAQRVMNSGEENAEASIRNCVTSINENGEIIRSFAA
ncbi:MAG: hypothetical protein IJS67_02870 [Clostridia bacterium]|nr:hypothetical protein [Clostridia bacterium]